MIKEYSITGDCTLIEAIRKIDEGGRGVLFILSEEGRMLGMLTDGDVRRSLLKGHDLSVPVSSIMNTKFAFAKSGQSKESIISYMKSIKRRHLPILDGEGRLVDVCLMDDIEFQKEETIVVLMAGGMGKRLGKLTEDRPKPMLKVGHKPILETIISTFSQCGFYRFVVSVNFKSHIIENYFKDGREWGVDIRYVREREYLGTAGALGLLEEKPKEPFIVMNGDLLTNMNYKHLIEYHREHGNHATMAAREINVCIPYGVVENNEHQVVNITEKPIHNYYVNAGIYVLDPLCLDHIHPHEHLDMTDLFKRMLEQKQRISLFPVREYWRDIGRVHELEKAMDEIHEYIEVC
jgi:dTDP-glucose pyrophosphorylase